MPRDYPTDISGNPVPMTQARRGNRSGSTQSLADDDLERRRQYKRMLDAQARSADYAERARASSLLTSSNPQDRLYGKAAVEARRAGVEWDWENMRVKQDEFGNPVQSTLGRARDALHDFNAANRPTISDEQAQANRERLDQFARQTAADKARDIRANAGAPLNAYDQRMGENRMGALGYDIPGERARSLTGLNDTQIGPAAMQRVGANLSYAERSQFDPVTAGGLDQRGVLESQQQKQLAYAARLEQIAREGIQFSSPARGSSPDLAAQGRVDARMADLASVDEARRGEQEAALLGRNKTTEAATVAANDLPEAERRRIRAEEAAVAVPEAEASKAKTEAETAAAKGAVEQALARGELGLVDKEIEARGLEIEARNAVSRRAIAVDEQGGMAIDDWSSFTELGTNAAEEIYKTFGSGGSATAEDMAKMAPKISMFSSYVDMLAEAANSADPAERKRARDTAKMWMGYSTDGKRVKPQGSVDSLTILGGLKTAWRLLSGDNPMDQMQAGFKSFGRLEEAYKKVEAIAGQTGESARRASR